MQTFTCGLSNIVFAKINYSFVRKAADGSLSGRLKLQAEGGLSF